MGTTTGHTIGMAGGVSLAARDGPARRRGHAGPGPGGGVLRGREPAQPGSRPGLLRHHQYVLRRDTADDPDGEGSSLRQYGHSKDHRKDLPQIVIGLAVTREGIPVRCWTWPGGTNDQTVVTEVKDGLRDWRPGRVVTVCDTGFSSEANQAYLKRAGGHYITGAKMRAGSRLADQALARQGRYQQVRDNLRVKEVRLDGDDGRRWIICRNPVEAMHDAARRDDQLTAVREELARIKTAREADAKKAKARTAKTGKRPTAPADAVHRKAECALRDHPTLGRWVKQHPATGRLSVDAAKVAAEARLDGKYLLANAPSAP
ncbi:transposase [Streptomyces sp. NPDC096030]|uniref:IS1634 family transposase n=1 Tax=Streptomyces sp. NPDC096030 TaxID=3155423 RepID=UPI00331CF14B